MNGFLISSWILLKVVDRSNLNHPNEFAAVTSHQITYSVLSMKCWFPHRVLRTQGYYPQGDNRKLNLLPRPSYWHLEGRGGTYWRNVEKSLHTLFIEYCFHLRALLWSFFLASLLPSSHFPPFLSPSVIFLPFSFPSFFLQHLLSTYQVPGIKSGDVVKGGAYKSW